MREKLKINFPTQGWRQFLTAKKEMLDSLDRAREKSRAHLVETHHGNVAEAAFRNWLTNFLPKRYGVTSGYVISPGVRSTEKVPHFDVIIYDQLESPILWIEESSDVSKQGRSLAIPAEYVQAVLEVKSSFSPATVGQAAEHLEELSALMGGPDDPNERYKLYLPPTFCCGMVFFDLKKDFQFSEAAMEKIISCTQYRGFFGSLILRGEDGRPQDTAKVSIGWSRDPIESSIGPGKTSLLRGHSSSQSVQVKEHLHYSSMLVWGETVFSEFAFNLVAMMQGTFDGRLSSFHAFGTSEAEAR